MNNRIDIPDWYELDFDINIPKVTLQSISVLINELKNQKLIDKWFYLFEGKTIRIRLHSLKRSGLEKTINDIVNRLGLTISPGHTFEQYWETTKAFSNIEVAKTFANIMANLTELTISRLDKLGIFSNYDLAERLSHCIFNNVYGSDTEVYFILKRLKVDFQLNDNPEQTVLDENQKYQLTNPVNIGIGSVNVPIKVGEVENK